jgi:hypothetical protein
MKIKKIMKRLFGRKKRTSQQQPESEGESGFLKSNSNHVKRPSDERRREERKESSSYSFATDEVSAPIIADKPAFDTSPKQELESKQEAKKEVPVMPPKLESESEDNSLGSTNNSPVKEADDRSVASSKSFASSTKSGSERAAKRVNANGVAPSPVKDKVDEVVVPQSSTENRHATISNAYDSIPLLEQTKLPRGGISIETEAVGRVQVR